MSPQERATVIKRLARAAGFERCGIAALGPIAHGDYYLEWLRRGWAGTMGYLHRRRETRVDPSGLLAGARSAIVVAASYFQRAEERAEDGAARGRIAMYAWGEDYHVVLPERLNAMVAEMRHEIDEPFEAKVCVDTSAIIERELAMAAGVGWIGKNTLVLHQDVGSYCFLGEILTTLELEPDEAAMDHCGSCTRCLEACPTQAFPAAYQMDATKCISYLTIEHRGEIEPALQATMGDWVFGCDVCQQVCPFNREAAETREARFAPRRPAASVKLEDVAAWDEREYEAATGGRALDRARMGMWKRNAGIADANAIRNGEVKRSD